MQCLWRRGRRAGPDRGLAAVEVGGTLTLGEVDLPMIERRRLAELGLRPGAAVTVMARTAGDGRLVGVGTSRVALDRRTAQRLSVRETGA